jgi:hypothetical protein
MYIIDPAAGKISENGKVLSCSEPLGLEAAHLARRCTTTRNRFFADDPAHRRIVPQPLGGVHFLVPSEAPEHRLSQQADESMPAVLAGARVGEHLTGRRGKAESVVELPVREQSRVGGDHRSAKLEH